MENRQFVNKTFDELDRGSSHQDQCHESENYYVCYTP